MTVPDNGLLGRRRVLPMAAKRQRNAGKCRISIVTAFFLGTVAVLLLFIFFHSLPSVAMARSASSPMMSAGDSAGDKQMHYRVYTVGNNGHFVSARDIEAPHDESAVLNAQKFIDGLDVEVWQAGRFVERIVAERRAWSRRSAGRR